MDIKQIREKYPEYGDISDTELVDALHAKHYADIPKEEFYSKVGLNTQSSISKAVGNAGGGAQAVLDMVGSIPGFIGAGTAALTRLTDTKTDRSFADIWKEVGQSASEGNIANMVPGAEKVRQTPGYEMANKALMSPFQGWGNILGGAAKVLGASDETAGTVGEYGDIGAQIGGMVLPGLKKAKPFEYRTPEQSVGDRAVARDTYPPDATPYTDMAQPTAPKIPPTDVISDQIMRDRFKNPEAPTEPIPGLTEYTGRDPELLQPPKEPYKSPYEVGAFPDEIVERPKYEDVSMGLLGDMPKTESPYRRLGEPTVEGIDFPLRQEVLERPEIKQAIEGFRGEDARLTSEIERLQTLKENHEQMRAFTDVPEMKDINKAIREAQIQRNALRSEFGRGMEQLGIKKPRDAFARDLYESGKKTSLPIEKTGTRNTSMTETSVPKLGEKPLGGVGKRGRRQGGAIDPDVFLSLIPQIKGTKIVDALGKLRLMYHGTSKDTIFKDIKANRNGAWFTSDPKEASGYATTNDSQHPVYDYEKRHYVTKNTASRVMPVYLDIKNPKVLDRAENNKFHNSRGDNYRQSQREYIDQAKREGYDGLISPDGDIVIAFDKSQIHSALSPNLITAARNTLDSIRNKWRGEPLNPKVKNLVQLLNKKGIFTELSGDMYGNDLVYVDIKYPTGKLSEKDLPQGWKITDTSAINTRIAHGLESSPTLADEGFTPNPDVIRLSKKGTSVSVVEANKIADTLSPSLGNTKMGKSQSGQMSYINHIADWVGEKLKKKPLDPKQGVAKSVAQALKSNDLPPEEFLKSLPAQIEDLSSKVGAKILSKFPQGSLAKQLAEHPVVSWAVDRFTSLVRDSEWQAAKDKFGATAIPSKFAIAKHKILRDPNAALTMIFDSLTPKELTLFREFSDKYSKEGRMPTSKELLDQGVSPQSVKAYENLQKGLNKVITEYNDLAVKLGKTPIKIVDGYMPAMRKGDFKLNVKNKDGEVIYTDIVDSKGFGIGDLRVGGAASLKKQMLKEFPDATVELTDLSMNRGDKNPYSINTTALQEVLNSRFLKENDKLATAVSDFIQQARSRRGFGIHGAQKKYIEGQMGYSRFKTDALNNHDFKSALEMYFDNIHKAMANMKIELEHRQVMADPRMKGKTNLTEYVNDVKNASQGWHPDNHYMLDILDNLANIASGGYLMGKAPGATRAMVGGLGKLAVMKFMGWKPSSLYNQLVQFPQFGAQMLSHYQVNGFDGNILRSITRGEMEVVKPTPEFMNFIKEYAIPQGLIDPQMIHTFDLFSEGTDARPKQIMQWVTGAKPLAAVEAVGRYQASAVGYHFFKESGLKGKELHAQVGEFVNNVMGDYKDPQRPQVYNDLGILGKAAQPLSTFHHLYLAQTYMFLKDLGKLNEVGIKAAQPIAMHLAAQAVFGGLYGMVLVKEWDMIIDGLKKIGVLDPETKNASEWILTKSNLNNLLAFGPIATATGLDTSTSVAAPEIGTTAGNLFPGPTVALDVAKNTAMPATKELLWNMQKLFKEKFGVDVQLVERGITRNEGVKAISALAPNSMQGLIEKYQPSLTDVNIKPVQPGEITPDINNRGLGGFKRDDLDTTARMLGFRSVKERREMEAQHALQSQTQLETGEKQKLVDLATDMMEGGTSGDIGQLAMKALQYGMTPDQFVKAVQTNVKNRQFEKSARMYGITPDTIAKYRKYQQLQEMMETKK